MKIAKENQVEISVIMTVHNTGKYLKEALDSIFNQNFKKFEIICVDDRSDDQLTRSILQTYQIRNKNMQVIWLEKNVGAAEARNTGFSKAKGKYTIFLDADDVFVSDFLGTMYQCICENEADVCVCGHEDFYIKNGKKYVCSGWMPDEQKINLDNREDWLLKISIVAWDKLCRTQFLKENNIYFQSLSTCNDVFFACRTMINAGKRCCIEKKPLIFYRINTGKQISSNRNPLDLYKAVMLLYDVEEKKYENNLLREWIGSLLLRNGVWESGKCTNQDFKYQYYRLIEKFFVDYKIIFQNALLEATMEKIKKLPYESDWFCNGIDFLSQLRLTAEKLKERLCEEQPLFLWGLGVRGNIFQQFCKEQNIKLEGIADIKNCNIDGETEYGNKIVSTKYVLQNKGLIIASNEKIYHYLLQMNVSSLNLEEFCFI